MSDLKVSGKITSILDVEKGVSKAGKDWQKQNFGRGLCKRRKTTSKVHRQI